MGTVHGYVMCMGTSCAWLLYYSTADYYGRCGPKLDEFYGRAYHVQPSQFSKNRLVGDGDYAKVQASMQVGAGCRGLSIVF